MSLQKCADLSDCEPISACATETPILVEIGLSYPILSYPILSYLILSYPVFSAGCSMFSGEFCLRLKPYLVVRIVSDVLTEHCCQVCILAMMFCCSDCRLCAGVCGKWLRNQGNSSYPGTSVPRVLACWPPDIPTWDMKNIFTFDFHILP